MPRGIPGSGPKKDKPKRKYTKRTDSKTESSVESASTKKQTRQPQNEDKINSQFDNIVYGIEQVLGKELRPSQVAMIGQTFTKLIK